MAAHEYQTGGWTALVTDGALALLHPGVADEVARELWQLTTTGRRLGAWVEYLASRGIATLPSFAMVEAHPDGLRVLVRGEVDVEIAGRTVSARGYATWREEVVPAATDVTIRAAADDGGWLPVTGGIVRAAAVRLAVDQEVPAAPLEEEDDDVELTVARMPALAAAVAGASASTPAEADDAAREPVEPAAAAPAAAPLTTGPADTSAAPDADAAGDRADDAAPAASSTPTAPAASSTPGVPAVPAGPADTATPAVVPAWLSGAPTAVERPVPVATPVGQPPAQTATPSEQLPVPPATPVEQPPADDATDAAAPAPDAEPQAVDDGATSGDGAAPGAATPDEEDPEESDDYDFLLWSTEQVRAREDDAPEAAPEPVAAPEAAVEPPAEPTPFDDGGHVDLEATREPEPEEHAGTTDGIIDSVPGRLRPAGPPPSAPSALPAPTGAPVGTPVDLPPPTDDGDHDGETILASDLPVTDVEIAVEPVERPAPVLELVLSTGPRIEMDRPVLLGRAPEAARFAGTEVPRLVSVSNPERDISSTHAEIRPAGGHVVVTDLNSTNGTVVHRPDQPSVRLQPGTGVPVGAGAVIELGTGVTVSVERPEGAQ